MLPWLYPHQSHKTQSRTRPPATCGCLYLNSSSLILSPTQVLTGLVCRRVSTQARRWEPCGSAAPAPPGSLPLSFSPRVPCTQALLWLLPVFLVTCEPEDPPSPWGGVFIAFWPFSLSFPFVFLWICTSSLDILCMSSLLHICIKNIF